MVLLTIGDGSLRHRVRWLQLSRQARVRCPEKRSGTIAEAVADDMAHSFDFGREDEGQACATRRVIGGPQAAAMRFHDGAADGQSHPDPLKLRGKERLEDLVRLLRG